MSIRCKVNIHKPENGAFIGVRGNVLSGVIKYTVHYTTPVTAITVSVKGIGTLLIEPQQKTVDKNDLNKEVFSETYIDEVKSNPVKESVLRVGEYETPFHFVIPHNIPPTLKYIKYGTLYNVRCKISYHVQIKFNKPDLMGSAKRFKKEIVIAAALVPTLPMTPVTYCGRKKLMQIFTSKECSVHVTAKILNSALRCGEKIRLDYQIVNDTNVVIKTVKVKVIEVYTFVFTNGKVIVEENVLGTDVKTAPIQNGDTQEMSFVANMPADRETLEFSRLVSREYYVVIEVKVPVPHRNYKLKMPIQIGNSIQDVYDNGRKDKPPNYWEAMHEDVGA